MKHGKITINADAAHDPDQEMNDLLDSVRHAVEDNECFGDIYEKYIAADAVLNAFARTQIFNNEKAWHYRDILVKYRSAIARRKIEGDYLK